MKHDVNAYKFDSRTQEQFLQDMEKGLKNEVKAINVFREILKLSTVENPELIYVGSDEEGKVKFDGSNVANVDLFPDYLLKYKTDRHRARMRLIEVKVCNPHSKFAYFKKAQLEQFIEIGNVLILFVMGISTADPQFILVRPQDIRNMGIPVEMIYGKETYRIHVRHFNWEKFEPFNRNYSLVDKHYIR
jgi:hypothetical protein